MFKGKKHFIAWGKFLLPVMLALSLGVSSVFAVEVETKTVSINDYQALALANNIAVPAHNHILAWVTTETEHYQMCTQCPYITNKGAHNFVSNGGKQFMVDDGQSLSDQMICSVCNMSTGKSVLVIQGRAEDYVLHKDVSADKYVISIEPSTISYYRQSFRNIHKITYKEFKDKYKNTPVYARTSGRIVSNTHFSFGRFSDDFTSCESTTKGDSFSDTDTGFVFVDYLIAPQDSGNGKSYNYGTLWQLGMMNMDKNAPDSEYRDLQRAEVYMLHQYNLNALNSGVTPSRASFVQWMRDGGQFLPDKDVDNTVIDKEAFRNGSESYKFTLGSISFDEYCELTGKTADTVTNPFTGESAAVIFDRWKRGTEWGRTVTLTLNYNNYRKYSGWICNPAALEGTDVGHALYGMVKKYSQYVTDSQFNSAISRIPQDKEAFWVHNPSRTWWSMRVDNYLTVKNGSAWDRMSFCGDGGWYNYEGFIANFHKKTNGRTFTLDANQRSWGRPDYGGSGWRESWENEVGRGWTVNLNMSDWYTNPKYKNGYTQEYINGSLVLPGASVSSKLTLKILDKSKNKIELTYEYPPEYKVTEDLVYRTYSAISSSGIGTGQLEFKKNGNKWVLTLENATWDGSSSRHIGIDTRYAKAGTGVNERSLVETPNKLYNHGWWQALYYPIAQDVGPTFDGDPVLTTYGEKEGWFTGARIKVNAKLVEKMYNQSCSVYIYPGDSDVGNITKIADWYDTSIFDGSAAKNKPIVSNLRLLRDSSVPVNDASLGNIREGGSYKTGKYSLNVDIPLETFDGSVYVVLEEKNGLRSLPKKVPIGRVDAKPPTITASTNGSNWTQTRVVTYTSSDIATRLSVGLTTGSSLGGWTTKEKASDDVIVQKYKFNGNADADGFQVSYYAVDITGNMGTIKQTISKVDNTKPVVRNVTYKSSDYNNMKVTVSASDVAGSIRGSGTYEAMDYAITTTNVEPEKNSSDWKVGNAPNDTTHYGSCDLDIPDAGTYYIWVRDSVDLVSSPYVLQVKHWGEKASGSGYDDLGKANTSTDSRYYGNGTPIWNANYNHHHAGFMWRDSDRVVQSGKTINMYYKRIRYTVAFDKGIGETGSMDNFGVVWGTNQALPANAFKKEYTYKVDPQGGDCSVTELKEAWDFKNWQYKTQNTPGWGTSDRSLADKESLQSNSIIIRDNQTVTLTAQWKKNIVTLPSVSLDGADFLGWFSKPQNVDVMTSDSAVNYRLGGIGDKVALEGKYWSEGETPTIYAWWNYRPVFADVYEGLFFEGQKISYKDLLELVKVFDYDAQYQFLAQSAVDAYFDEAMLAVDNKINDIEEKLYKVENEEAEERLEEQLEKLYTQSEFIGEMRLRANEEVEKRFLQPYVVQLDYHRDDESNPYKVVDEHGTQDSENKDEGVALKIIKDEAKVKGYWENHYLDTSSKCVGDVIVTYQVTDPGISIKGLINEVKNSDSEFSDVSVTQFVKGGVIPDSKITMEYSRPCQINFNYNPTIKPMTLQFFTGDDLGDSFTSEVLKAQYAFDPEDSKSNAPWWSHKASYADLDADNAASVPAHLKDKNLNTKKRLQENLTVTGIAKIRMNGTFAFRFRDVYQQVLSDFVSPESDTTKGVAKDSIIDKGDLLDTLYAFRGSKRQYAICQDKITKKYYSITEGNIWDMLESIEVTFDTKDQWGKYASNKVALVPEGESGVVTVDTSKAPEGYMEKYLGIKRDTETQPGDDYDPAVYQAPEQRTATIIMIYSKAEDPDEDMCDCGCGKTVKKCTCDSCKEEGRHPIYCQCGCGKTVEKCTCKDCSDTTHKKYCQCSCGKPVDECTCEDCPDKNVNNPDDGVEYCKCPCGKPVDECECEDCPDKTHEKYCTCGCGQLEKDCRCKSCIENNRHPIYCHCGCGKTIQECDCPECPDNHPRYCQCGCGELEKDCKCKDCSDDHPKYCQCGCGKTIDKCTCKDCPYRNGDELCDCGCGATIKECICDSCKEEGRHPIYCQCGCGKTVDKCTCKDCPDKTHGKYCPCGCGELLVECKCEDCIYRKMLCDCGCGEYEKDCTCENCSDGPHDGSKLCACGCGKTEKECTCENCKGSEDGTDTHEPWCQCGCGERISECKCKDCPDDHPRFCQCGCGLLEKDCSCDNCPDDHDKYCQCGCGHLMDECTCPNCPYKPAEKYCPCGCGNYMKDCTCADCPYRNMMCECGCGEYEKDCKCENCPDGPHDGSKLCECGCGATEKDCTCGPNCPGHHEQWCKCGCGKRASECDCEDCKDTTHLKWCQCGCGLLEKDCTCENCPDKHPEYCKCGCGELVIDCDCENCKDIHIDYCHCGCGKPESECTCENCSDDHPKYCTCGCGQIAENCKCKNCTDPSHGGGGGGTGGGDDDDPDDDDDGIGTIDDPIPFDPWEDTMDNFGLDTTRVDTRVRFIEDGHSSMLGRDYIKTLNQSFWSKGLGSSILSGSFEAKDERQLRESYTGEYEDRQGNKVPVTVKDYTQ